MADFPSYAYGTVTVAANGTVVTGTDTLWSGVNARSGDDITIAGHTVIVVDVTDETHLTIDAWPYDAVTDATYKIVQRSPLRFVGGQARADLTQLLSTLKAKGLMWYLPDGLSEPDDAKPPLTADEGQVIQQATTGRTWVMQSGAWFFVGTYKGLGVAAPWDAGTSYNVNDVVSLNGTSYVAIAPNTNQEPPNATYWVVLAAKGDTGATGPTGPGYGGTSTTSLTIGTGSKAFATQAGLAYENGARVRASDSSNGLNWMEGLVTYSGTTLTMTSDKTNGSGTIASWNFNIAGVPGAGDLSSANDLSDLHSIPAARGNLGVDLLAGFRNKIINGDFDIWQRGTSFSATGYTADRWMLSAASGSTQSLVRGDLTVGMAVGNGAPRYCASWSVSNAGSGVSVLEHRMEGVRTLSGRTVTATFYASAGASTTLTVDFVQVFGSGGSPSSAVSVTSSVVNLTTTLTKFSLTFNIPSIAGKTLGSNGDDYLALRLYRQSTATIYITHVSVVDGDATAEYDPFSPRHIGQELGMCQRYFCCSYNPSGKTSQTNNVSFFGAGPTSCNGCCPFPTTMRVVPTVTTYNPLNSGASGEIRWSGANIAVTSVRAGVNRIDAVIVASGGTTNGLAAFHFDASAEL